MINYMVFIFSLSTCVLADPGLQDNWEMKLSDLLFLFAC